MGMTWKQKIVAGMQLISSGCKQNTSRNECDNCPFDDFCDNIMKCNDGLNPSELFLLDEDRERKLT